MPFDAVFAAGIFYHLDRPLAFLQKAATVCRKIIFLETQYTYAERTPPCDRHSLSDLCENEGVMGRWYPEHDEAPGTKLETLKWASWENRRSFWIQREYLLDAINRVGFDIVLEQHDIHSGDIVSGIKRGREEEGDRGMFIGIRRGPDSGTSWRKSWWSSRFGRRHNHRLARDVLSKMLGKQHAVSSVGATGAGRNSYLDGFTFEKSSGGVE